MFCNHCGAKLADGSQFCSVCGQRQGRFEAPVQPQHSQPMPAPAQTAQ